MEHGPVPPHERTWRHPSELAAEERLELRATVAPRTTRATALAAGTFGLLFVATLVLVITPRDLGAPIAVSATTTLDTLTGDDRIFGVSDGVSGALGISGQPSVTSRDSTTTVTPTSISAVFAALATPVGDGTYAVMTARSLDGQIEGTVEFRLSSGAMVSGPIMYVFDDATVVSVPVTQTPHAIADEQPHNSDTVTVMAETPMQMAFADVSGVDVPEGTPIVDRSGALVGLCSKNEDGTTAVVEMDPTEIASPTSGSVNETVTTTSDGRTPQP